MINREDIRQALDIHGVVDKICARSESHEEYALKMDLRTIEALEDVMTYLIVRFIKARGLFVD